MNSKMNESPDCIRVTFHWCHSVCVFVCVHAGNKYQNPSLCIIRQLWWWWYSSGGGGDGAKKNCLKNIKVSLYAVKMSFTHSFIHSWKKRKKKTFQYIFETPEWLKVWNTKEKKNSGCFFSDFFHCARIRFLFLSLSHTLVIKVK